MLHPVCAMSHKRIIPALLLACWMPLPSAHAEGEVAVVPKQEGAAVPKQEGAAIPKQEGDVVLMNPIGAIRQAYRNGDYELALKYIELARQRPLGTSELVTLSHYEGILLYELGRFLESGDAFEMALLIEPDKKLPEPVSPKIESHFETVRKKVQMEPPPSSKQKPSPQAPSNCPSGLIMANGRTLKAQQLWRLAMMEQMLCVRGIRGGEVASKLSAFKAQVSQAGSPTEWVRVIQEIDLFAKEYAVYPFNEDWRHVKSLVPEDRWELGDEDQDVTLPEAPESPDEEPASLFGCRAAVAPECERLMRRLLLLQNQLSGVKSEDRFTARTELMRLGRKVREASTSEQLKAASHDTDEWQSRWH